MAPSQLKRLKASLREHGIVGPQKSKQQKKQASKNGISKEKKMQRSAALQGIRDQFNPFEAKPARSSKYEFVNSDRKATSAIVRPGVTKGLGEEIRRRTLLVEMQRRRKVGGIIDRRFGEDDPSIAPEEKALQRFVKEKQMGRKKGTLFDLEDDEDNEEELTHLGKSLSFDYGKVTDVLDEDGLVDSQDEDADAEGAHRSRKRRRLLGSDGEQGSETLLQTAPDRPKTKQEVMKEVIAKSKFHKYERQKNKEDDDDLRAELDRGLSDIYDLMRGTKATSAVLEAKMILNTEPTMNPDRAALLNGKDRSQADKEYDERLRQMAFDARSKPTTRTKTEDEKLYEEARKLKELEEKRLARMRGDETEDTADGTMLDFEGDDGAENVEEDAVGLGQGIPVQSARNELGVEDEDDFDLDDDLIASSFETDISEADDSGASSAHPDSSDDEAEFVKDLLSNEDIAREEFRHSAYETRSSENGAKSTLAFTYPCPQTHQELLEVTKDVSVCDLPIVIQRIRAVNHPKLASGNKAKLGVFSGILVEHIYYMANQPTPPPFSVLESMIRHVHSLAKSFPGDVGRAARKHLKEIQDQRPTAFNAGDMVIFTAIGSIFPTSDHFHQVVTPAILSMARYLGQRVPHSLADLVHATYVATLCLQYQRLSKRYIPEAVNHSLQVMSVLSPTKSAKPFGPFPDRASASQLRIGAAERGNPATNRQLRFWDLNHISDVDIARDEELKEVLLEANLSLTSAMAELWISKTAFYEIFDPFSHAFGHLLSKDCFIKLRPSVRETIRVVQNKLQRLLQQARLGRRQLLLHHHRPLAIKTSIPKFEESYNPERHYDPDRDRADSSKLKAEHKRERKGALRELRKDANFMARESLRAKKERDAEYEKKYKRLVAEIQGEEGREANAYEREKRMRKSKR